MTLGGAKTPISSHKASPRMSRGLLQAIVEALMLARAHPEAIKAAVAAYEAWERTKRPVGRQRKYADTPARRRAYNEQRRKKPVGTGGGPDEARPRYDTGSDSLRYDLRVRLIDASNGNIDPLADIAPIRALLAQGCDLELTAPDSGSRGARAAAPAEELGRAVARR